MRNKKLKIFWVILALLMIIGMLSFTIAPLLR